MKRKWNWLTRSWWLWKFIMEPNTKNACSLLDMTINCRCRGKGGRDIRQAKEQKDSKHMFEAMSKMNGMGVVAWNGQQKLSIKTNGNMTIKSPLTSQLKQLTIDGRGERITTLQKIRSIKSAVKPKKWKRKWTELNIAHGTKKEIQNTRVCSLLNTTINHGCGREKIKQKADKKNVRKVHTSTK